MPIITVGMTVLAVPDTAPVPVDEVLKVIELALVASGLKLKLNMKA
jgi:hypothetical protein